MDEETIAGESDRVGRGNPSHRTRGESAARAGEPPGRPEPGRNRQEVGLARSTVQRIVAALAAEEFVTEAQPGRGVRIGAGLARIAASLGSNIAELLRPHLHALVRGGRRNRRSLCAFRRLRDFRRTGSRPTAAGRGVGGGRSISSALHRQRQSDSLLLRQAGRACADRQEPRRARRPSARRLADVCFARSKRRAARTSLTILAPHTVASARSASPCSTSSVGRSQSRYPRPRSDLRASGTPSRRRSAAFRDKIEVAARPLKRPDLLHFSASRGASEKS